MTSKSASAVRLPKAAGSDSQRRSAAARGTAAAVRSSDFRSNKMLGFADDCYYNLIMPTWDERKRRTNIKRHGLDFEGAEAIWDNLTVTREDIRHSYGEARFVTFGLLDGEVVVLVYTERENDIHIISLRRAEKYEARYYFEATKEIR